MIGCRIRSNIIRRSYFRSDRPAHQIIESEVDLVKQFEKMHISGKTENQFRRLSPKILCVAFHIHKRHYHATTVNYKRITKDHPDLDYTGAVRKEILECRMVFLKEHGMLNNKIDYFARIVYANYHLYDVNQVDSIGRSNLKRMQCGLCPIDKTGKDILSIHHFDQTMAGPWVILPNLFHQQQSPYLHSNVTLANGVDKIRFATERIEYWKYQARLVLEHKVKHKL
jgi:hypothetical protein